MDKDSPEDQDKEGWLVKLQYWGAILLVIFMVLLLFVMLGYGAYFSSDCDFGCFILFKCSFASDG